MALSDWVLIGVLVLAVLFGWRWGTINVAAKIGSLIVGYLAARTYAAVIANAIVKAFPALTASGEGNEKLIAFLSLFIQTEGIANRLIQMVMFVLIFIVVSWAIRRIAYALTGIFGRGLLGKINRAFGALLSLALTALFVVILSDIVFPALVGLGVGQAPLAFLNSSQLILPFIHSILAVL